MIYQPKKIEIDHHAIKLLIGTIALLLAGVAYQLSGQPPIESISASYHRTDWARNMFVGSLFAIFALLIAYNGRSGLEWCLSKVAAIAALGVALFPCSCGSEETVVSQIHGISAGIMFIILAIFCYLFVLRARSKEFSEAKRRIFIYWSCCGSIVVSVVAIALNYLTEGWVATIISRPVYVFEAIGLIAFGIAWLTASRMLPVVTNKDERISLSSF